MRSRDRARLPRCSLIVLPNVVLPRKQAAAAHVEQQAKLVQEMVDSIFSFAEPGFQEFETSRYITRILEENGFIIRRGVSGIPTAWTATWGADGPLIAMGSDIDALLGLSQVPGSPTITPQGAGCSWTCRGAQQWVGSTETAIDQVTVTLLKALAATLDRRDPEPQPGQPIPPCWHWLYFPPLYRHSELGPDGHALRGGFLPPVPLPLRMSAGAQITFIRPLCVGDAIQRTSRIIDVSAKQGSAGSLVFVRVRHEISNAGGLAVIDEQNIVYRERRPVGARERSSIPQVMEHDWMREIRPDALLLFRYSALTFNAHRIHYDQRYVREVEQYPGLVVHGPLIATLLLDLLRSQIPNAEVSKFTFRVIKPTYDGAILQLYGKCAGQAVQLWATHRNGDLAMQATAELARAV